ncbi:P-loop containing nucleoside triphosphate hydrolase protein [Suillus clintonianus]|uniref:P-loop containing nucleoside triphosphate hydrolase protein n=1 Tax=Suillus clintonianus TaxID=1904413 RepID=UPI001B868013|nr:P-loop containing nucleoside triphosphate hydrolase protein [Suillus clintonianus]KAG2153828.1 P-loop containing nucleoside triphosphate hydrolase protein [Suillus clintonianus]
MSVFNVLVVGHTGCGKSSIVNILAGESRAPTSDDASNCTKHWAEYAIPVDGRSFQVFDTIGFLDPTLGTEEYTNAIADTYFAIDALRKRGGIDLLLYCVRNEEIPKMKGYYRLLHEVFCDEEVPVALVVTNRGTSGIDYKAIFRSHKIDCVSYVCADVATPWSGSSAVDTESQKAIKELLVKCCDAGPNSRSTLQQLRRLVQKFVGADQSLTRKKVSTLLTQRCEMEPKVAEQLLEALELQSPSSRLYRAPYARGTITRELPSSENSASIREEQVSDARPSSSSQLHSVLDSTSLHSRPNN